MDASAGQSDFAYDAVPYVSPAIPAQTSDRLAAALLLAGRSPPDPATGSVLEIGCGDALNLLAIAAVAPEARCVGFDLSAPAIERGAELAAAAGLTNVELAQGDILTWPVGGEKFDYVTCHGVYSWVPEAVRTALLALIAAKLKPGGIGYVSFDCLPAAGPKASLRAYFRPLVATIADPNEKAAEAFYHARLLQERQRQGSRLKPALDDLLAGAADVEPAHFVHNWLGDIYAPVSTADFEALAAAVGLNLVGDAGLAELYTGDLDAEALGLLHECRTAAERLSLLDLLRGEQTFRRAILMRADAPPAPVEDGWTALRFAFLGRSEPMSGTGVPLTAYASPDGAMMTPDGEGEREMMELLHAAAPGELTLGELRIGSGASRPAMEAALRKAAGIGLIEVHATPQPFVPTPGERPQAGRLIRTMMERGDRAITLRHLSCHARDPATRALLTLCDGSRTRAGLAAALSAQFSAPVGEPQIAAVVADLARQAVFEA